MTAPRAALVAVGTELLAYGRPDTNGASLARLLAERGVRADLSVRVPDDEDAISRALVWIEERFDLVVVTGGLGPTRDDVTREACAGAFGLPLQEDAASLHAIEERLRARGREPTIWSRRQARLPRGAAPLPNAEGTAAGFLFRGPHGHLVVALPGVPHEMTRMMTEEALPRLQALGILGRGRPETIRALKVAGLTEVEVQRRLDGLLQSTCAGPPPAALTLLASPGGIAVILRGEDEAAVASLGDAARARLGPAVFTESLDEGLEAAVGRRLAALGLTIATAESCTGGLLGSLLTRTPGSSAWYLQGWVVYSDRAKASTLGIDPALIAARGAVSAEVAGSMAAAAREGSGADLGVGITGIAGPSGGTPEKPVGLVFIGLASARGRDVSRFQFGWDRESIRQLAAHAALERVRRELLEESGP